MQRARGPEQGHKSPKAFRFHPGGRCGGRARQGVREVTVPAVGVSETRAGLEAGGDGLQGSTCAHSLHPPRG